MQVLSAEWVEGPLCTLGEGPLWADGGLTWVDILPGHVHHWDPRSLKTTTVRYGDTVSLVVPRAAGGDVLSLGATLVLRNPDGSVEVLAELGAGHLRCNDGGAAPDGALYVGTMRRDATGREGQLFRISPEGEVTSLLGGLGISNGLGFDLCRDRTYFVDSRDARVDLLDLCTGARSIFVDLAAAEGLPDGLTVDVVGAVWVAMHGAGQVLCFSCDGVLLRRVEVPAPHVTSCAFGGALMTDLFITTARENLTEEQLRSYPRSGGLFRVRGAGQGLSSLLYAG